MQGITKEQRRKNEGRGKLKLRERPGKWAEGGRRNEEGGMRNEE